MDGIKQYRDDITQNAIRESNFKKISRFYDDPEKALEILKNRIICTGEVIEFKKGGRMNLYKFLKIQRNLYLKRIEHNTPHPVNILENELSDDLYSGGGWAMPTKKLPTLDVYNFKKPDFFVDKYTFGKWFYD